MQAKFPGDSVPAAPCGKEEPALGRSATQNASNSKEIDHRKELLGGRGAHNEAGSAEQF